MKGNLKHSTAYRCNKLQLLCVSLYLHLMKNTLSGFLVIVFLFNLFGYFPAYKLAQYKIRKEMKAVLKQKIPANELIIFTIRADKLNSLHWTKKNKEFRHQDQMFDVVSMENKDGLVYLRCINDRQESKLFAHLEEFVSKQMGQGKNPLSQTAKLILKKINATKYLPLGFFLFLKPEIPMVSGNSIPFIAYCNVTLDILSPPPDQKG